MNSNNNFYLTQPLEVNKKHFKNNISYYIETNDKSFLLKYGLNYIGRDEKCEIQIDDETLSRKHAMIEVTSDGSVFIQDLCSVNKTFRNDCQLRKSVMYELTNGNRVNFGKITAKFIEIANSPKYIEGNESENSDLFSNDSCNENQLLSQSQIDENPVKIPTRDINSASQLDDTEILEENSVTNDKIPETGIKPIQMKGNDINFYVTSTPSNRNKQKSSQNVGLKRKKSELESVLDNLLLNTEMGVFNDSEIQSNGEKSEENCCQNSIENEPVQCDLIRNKLKPTLSSVDIFHNSQSTTDEDVLSETDLEDNDDKYHENKHNNAVILPSSFQELRAVNPKLGIDNEESNKQKQLKTTESDENLTESDSSAVLIHITNKGFSEPDKKIIGTPTVTMGNYLSIDSPIREDDDDFDYLPTQKLGNEIIDYQTIATQIVKETDRNSNNCSCSQAIYSQIATQSLSDQQKPENCFFNKELELPSKLANEIIATQIVKETSDNNTYPSPNQSLSDQPKPKIDPLNIEQKIANEITATQIVKENDKTTDKNSYSNQIQPLSDQLKPENDPLNIELKLTNEITANHIITETEKTINNNNNSIYNPNQFLPNSTKPSLVPRPDPGPALASNQLEPTVTTTASNNNKKSKSRKTPSHKQFEKEITDKIVTLKEATKQKPNLTENKENDPEHQSEISKKLSNFHRKLQISSTNNSNNNPMDIFEFRCDSDDFIDSNEIAMITNTKAKPKKVLKERNIEPTKENDEKNSKKINFRATLTSQNAVMNAVVVLSDVGKTTNRKGGKTKSRKTNSDLNPVDIDEDIRDDQSGGTNATINKDLINNQKIHENFEGNNNSRNVRKVKEKKSKNKIYKNKENIDSDKNGIKTLGIDENGITEITIATGKRSSRKSSIIEEKSINGLETVKQEKKSILTNPDRLTMETEINSSISTSKRKRGRPPRSNPDANIGTTRKNSNIRITDSKRIKLSNNEIDNGKCVKTEKVIGKRKFQSDGCEEPKNGRKSARKSTRGRKSKVIVDRIIIDELQCPAVMFTGLNEPKNEQIIRTLGGELIDDVVQVDCLVTDKIRRTVKFLCCLARGVPIVSPDWLVSSQHSKRFVDTRPFIVKNNAESFNINLETSIDLASNYQRTTGGIMAHYKCIVYVAGATKPDSSQLEQIITCAGGKMLSIQDVDFYEHLNDVESKHICVADPELMKTDNQDLLDRLRALKVKSIDILSVEFILTMIMEQKWPPQENYRLNL